MSLDPRTRDAIRETAEMITIMNSKINTILERLDTTLETARAIKTSVVRKYEKDKE